MDVGAGYLFQIGGIVKTQTLCIFLYNPYDWKFQEKGEGKKKNNGDRENKDFTVYENFKRKKTKKENLIMQCPDRKIYCKDRQKDAKKDEGNRERK
jgi:hypothetical protein